MRALATAIVLCAALPAPAAPARAPAPGVLGAGYQSSRIAGAR